ncbi:PepSY domain-containing protein [Sulfurimonas sp. NW15]|uniref:PepSY domain-containing protein n=1 Tax=Sulfurimonas sp. NW15 TaxID=2922729 RepID=UPI003DA8C0B8
MVKIYKLHKIVGLSFAAVLALLAFTGFLLDHDKWSFLYTITFKSVPQKSMEADKRLFEAYYIDKKNPGTVIAGGKRGLFKSTDAGKHFEKISSLQCNAIREQKHTLYIATSQGVYCYDFKKLTPLVLKNRYISSLALYENKLVAVEEKERVYVVDIKSRKVTTSTEILLPKEALQEDIKLSRFIRDLHYARGLFDEDLSLFLNDYGALVLLWLSISGYIIWYLIRSKQKAQFARKMIKTHANIFVIFSIFPLFILLTTGIFLDHASALGKFMKSVTIPHKVLPPIYNTLKADIWAVDYDGKVYRIGNRYGIYKSRDLNKWQLENRGFAYRMIRRGKLLYVSGMGAPNRILDAKHFEILKNAPHMFRDIIEKENRVEYFSPVQKSVKLPQFHEATLYSVLLTLHDGSFFASWWIWVNDAAALSLLLLLVSGFLRWRHKRKHFKYLFFK